MHISFDQLLPSTTLFQHWGQHYKERQRGEHQHESIQQTQEFHFISFFFQLKKLL